MIEILLVERYEVMRDGLRALIDTELDMVVIGEAIDGPTAIERAHFLHPDIVIVDPMSLGPDSIPTISSLKQVNPKTRILILTNYIDKGEVQAALQAGARGYMLKARPLQSSSTQFGVYSRVNWSYNRLLPTF